VCFRVESNELPSGRDTLVTIIFLYSFDSKVFIVYFPVS
jgi:hypothetical protein